MNHFFLNDAAPAAHAGGARAAMVCGVAAMVLTAYTGTADASMWNRGYGESPYVSGVVALPLAGMHRPAQRSRTNKSSAKTATKTVAKPLQAPIIVVSVGSQRLTVYDRGAPVASAPVSTGTPGHRTPTGIFSVIQKQKVHYSNIYDSAPMPYMQRITWSGVALHAGLLPGYAASHGCIRMPRDFAVRLWSMTRMGTRVIVARNDIAPQEIANPRLFVLNKMPEVSRANPPVVVATAGPLTPPEPAVAAQPAGLIEPAAPAAATKQRTGAVAPESTTSAPAKLDSSIAPQSTEKPLRAGPVAVFVSRKEGKLFVRKGFAPVFEMPVTIDRADSPIGTHVFTASELKEDGSSFRWLVVSMPGAASSAESRRNAKGTKPAPVAPPAVSAAEALDRITFPPEAIERISQMMGPGASLTVSDQGLGPETGEETDFIVVTR